MTTPSSGAPRSQRRLYVDWLRGVAVLVMILWHSIDSWTRLDARASAAFPVITFFGGWAAPLFLFLAGVSVPLAGAARLARGQTRAAVSRALQRRGWEIFLIAHLFRFQSFMLNPNGKWNSLFKADILNVLALALVLAAYLWGRARSTRELGWLLLVPAAIIAGVVTPLAPTWWWPSLLTPRLEGYIRIVDNNAVFSLFPTSAYLLAGTFFGALTAGHDAGDEAFQRRTAIWGGALFAVAGFVAFVPWPRRVAFWTAPPAIVAWRIGTMVVASAAAWYWMRRRSSASSNWLVVFGRTSLFVYWVHVELAYGNFSFPLHHALPLPWSLAGFAGLTALMLGLARLWDRRRAGDPLVPPHLVAPVAPAPGRLGRHPLILASGFGRQATGEGAGPAAAQPRSLA